MSLDPLVAPDLRRRFQSVPPHLGSFRTSCDKAVTITAICEPPLRQPNEYTNLWWMTLSRRVPI
jgi:hypothetical protein